MYAHNLGMYHTKRRIANKYQKDLLGYDQYMIAG